MKGISIFWTLILFSFITFAEEVGDNRCIDSTLKDTPFYISDTYEQGKKVFENLRDLKDSSKVDKYIPMGSIVYTPKELLKLETSDDFRMPIKVLSVPGAKVEKTLANAHYKTKKGTFNKSEYREKVLGSQGLTRTKVHDEGFIDKRSLKKINDYSFFVKKDSKIYKSHKGTILNNKKIQLKMNSSGEFITKRCCFLAKLKPRKEICNEFYIYEILDFDKATGEFKVVDEQITYSMGCGFISDLLPIPEEDSVEFANINDILKQNISLENNHQDLLSRETEIVYYKTRDGEKARIDLVKLDFDKKGRGPFNSAHYKPDDKNNSDGFVKMETKCAFYEVLRKMNTACTTPGCRVLVGNTHHEGSWGVHESHGSGECMDIRPFRKDTGKNSDDYGDGDGLTYASDSYDRAKTEKFIDILIQAGATNIALNDDNLRNKYNANNKEKLNKVFNNDIPIGTEKLHKWKGHENHIHFCLESNRVRVQNSCKFGVKP